MGYQSPWGLKHLRKTLAGMRSRRGWLYRKVASLNSCRGFSPSPRARKEIEMKTEKIGKWMPLHINEFHQECRGFPLEFQAMYLNLLATMWQNDGQISDDEDYLMRASGATKSQWNKHRQDLANLFTMGHGSWNHNRIREELAKAYKISDTKRAAINKRWDRTRSLAKVATDALMAQITADGGSF